MNYTYSKTPSNWSILLQFQNSLYLIIDRNCNWRLKKKLCGVLGKKIVALFFSSSLIFLCRPSLLQVQYLNCPIGPLTCMCSASCVCIRKGGARVMPYMSMYLLCYKYMQLFFLNALPTSTCSYNCHLTSACYVLGRDD